MTVTKDQDFLTILKAELSQNQREETMLKAAMKKDSVLVQSHYQMMLHQNQTRTVGLRAAIRAYEAAERMGQQEEKS